jgi:hypothetical protein
LGVIEQCRRKTDKMKYSAIIEKYRNPRVEEEVILKKNADDTNVAKLFTLTYVKNSPTNHFIKPWKLKDQIARDIQSTIDETDGEIKIERDNDSHLRRLLHPNDFETTSSVSF